MSQPGRVVSVMMVIDDPDKAGWVWDAMKEKETHPEVGVRVLSISNGDLFEQYSILENGLKQMAGHILAEEDPELDELYDEKEQADYLLEKAEKAPRKYDYDGVLCRYSHQYLLPFPPETQRETGASSNEGGTQDQA